MAQHAAERGNAVAHLIFDIGGVLLNFSLPKDLALPPRLIKTALDSPTWHDYERGCFSSEECYQSIAAAFNLNVEVWERTVEQLRLTLTPNVEFVDQIKAIKKQNPHIRIHAFSNISMPDFEYIKPLILEWDVFDRIVTSASIGSRKPENAAYHALQETVGCTPCSTIFIDDRVENVVTAQSLGYRGILFKTTVEAATKLHNMLGDPVCRGLEFLQQRAQAMSCVTEQNIEVKDNFSQLLIYKFTGNQYVHSQQNPRCLCTHKSSRALVQFENCGPTWQFFIGERAFTDHDFPKDADTTSLALATLDIPIEQKEVALQAMLDNLTADGLPLVR